MKGSAATPAANQINLEAIKLDMKQAETFHHLMAKLLYLCKTHKTQPANGSDFSNHKGAKPRHQ